MTRTNVDLDEALVERGFEATGLHTKKALLHHALSELLRRESQLEIRRLKGKIHWEGNLGKLRATRKFA